MVANEQQSKFSVKEIITAKESIKEDDLRDYILENLSTFEKGSKFVIFGGHHHMKTDMEKPNFENISVAHYDPNIPYDHHKE